MSQASDIKAFCQRIGHRFAQPDLLKEALTHASVSSATQPNNERLEFLGDRVLGLVMSEALLAADRGAAEGVLAPRYNALVRKETCAAVAREIELGKVLRLGRSEMLSGGRRKDALLADALEAVIAAVYLDAGFRAAHDMVLRLWGQRIAHVKADARDPKTALQEWAQARGQNPPQYNLMSRDGPDHAPRFNIAVRLDSGETERAEAGSKRQAEQEAARVLLERLTGETL